MISSFSHCGGRSDSNASLCTLSPPGKSKEKFPGTALNKSLVEKDRNSSSVFLRNNPRRSWRWGRIAGGSTVKLVDEGAEPPERARRVKMGASFWVRLMPAPSPVSDDSTCGARLDCAVWGGGSSSKPPEGSPAPSLLATAAFNQYCCCSVLLAKRFSCEISSRHRASSGKPSVPKLS